MIANIPLKATCLLIFITLSFMGKAQLKADFTSQNASGCAPTVVNFTDQSSGNPTQWKWDLGNGTISYLQNPSVTYFGTGTYTVTLTIKKGNSTDSVVKQNFVTVFNAPSVNFTSDKISGCFPLTVKFKDLSTPGSGALTNWIWDFGDGNKSDSQFATHTYLNPGNFNVTLKVTNSNGCYTAWAKTSYIVVSTGVTAGFSNDSPSVCSAPVNVNFTNQSIGTGNLKYLWNFGDGTTSTSLNSVHTYSSKGNYTVSLAVTNAAGCTDTATKINAINIGKLKAGFTYTGSTCLGNQLNFTSTTTPSPSSVQWSFGDNTFSTNLNPSKIFQSIGTYQITFIANGNQCSDTTTQSVSISNTPTAHFSADKTNTCQSSLKVNFTNLSSGGNTYLWIFGDGDSSTSFNATHTYTQAGTYSVTLVATNVSGCSNTYTAQSFIQLIPPIITLQNLPDSGCGPFTKSFSFSSDNGNAITSYVWNFGDGTTSTLQSPVHTYLNSGIYSISLITTTSDGCVDTTIMANAIKVTSKPTVQFSADPREVCAILPVKFSDNTIGNVDKWFWTFGDGGTANNKNPKHVYNDTGYFDIRLIDWNGGCSDTLKIKNYIYVKPPIAKFNVANLCLQPFVKNFIDKSIGADTWNWDFGDGSTSTLENPTHVYNAVGNYDVKLVVHNDSTGCDYNTDQTVQVVVTNPTFAASDTEVCKNTPITFSVPAANSNFLTNFSWSFGNGDTLTSIGASINYTYTKSGYYDIGLITTNTLGCMDTIFKPKYIRVDGPTANFSSTNPGYCANTSVSFINNSVNDGLHSIIEQIWTYGDGKIDTIMSLSGRPANTSSTNQTHVYSLPGNYPVSLKTIDTKGCSDTYNGANPIAITKPVANFSSDTLFCTGTSIAFNNLSKGLNLSYNWNLGDLTSSADSNPVHLYSQPGSYSVSLKITDLYGCTDSMSKPNTINIVIPRSNFSMSDSESTCPPLMVNFKDSSKYSFSIKWDFGDSTFSNITNPSHFYTYPGTYIVRQIISGPNGCQDIMTKRVIIGGPTGTLSYDPVVGCSPIKIDFKSHTQNNLSFIWDYSDGVTLKTTDSTVSHIYTIFGAYIPKMILVDKLGCTVPITGKDTIKVFGAKAGFTVSSNTLCDSGYVTFSDKSSSYDSIVSYTWNFGNGVTSSEENVTYKFTNPGNYISKLSVITEHGCNASAIIKSPVKVVVSPKIGFTNMINGCVPVTEIFTGQILLKDTSALSWNWNFGNGDTSIVQNPGAIVYNTAAVYNPLLTVTNSSGCVTTAQNTLEAYPIPNVRASLDTFICKGSSINLIASGADKYAWDTASSLSCLNCFNPIANPSFNKKYYVTGTTNAGCSNNDSVFVMVKQPFSMAVTKNDTLCMGSSSTIAAVGAFSYNWSPNYAITDPTKSVVTVTPENTTTYMVIGTDDRKCFYDTGYINIRVFPIPTVEAGKNITINIGESTTLTPTVSNDVTIVNWTPLTGLVSREQNFGINVKPKETTEYTVEVQNPGGCTAQDKITVFVICNGANIFMPNTFTPNGDGINDIYYPRGTGIFKIKHLRIFNRWGELVFDRENFNANDPNFAWDGRFKGAMLSSDVFVYTIDVICENNEVLTFKGNIALLN